MLTRTTSVAAAQIVFVTVIVSDTPAPRLAVELVITPAWFDMVIALPVAAAAVPLSTFEKATSLRSTAVFEALKEFTVLVMKGSRTARKESRIVGVDGLLVLPADPMQKQST